MSEEELRALRALSLNWTRGLEDVWTHCEYDVPGLHEDATRRISRGIDEAARNGTQNPLGAAIVGDKGAGKTHLLGWARERAQAQRGYFFLAGDFQQTEFWAEILRAIVEQLQPLPDGSRQQLRMLLSDLAEKAGLDDAVRSAVSGERPPSPGDVSAFVEALRQAVHLHAAHQDTVRALVLLGSPQSDHSTVGSSYFNGGLALEEGGSWGIKPPQKAPQQLIRELSGLLALSGPTVLAIDQIDALVDDINRAGRDEAAKLEAMRPVANGLMSLRDTSQRTLTVVSCLTDTWEYLRRSSVGTVVDRFVRVPLTSIPSAEVGCLMIEKRFALGFESVRFDPPYPSWPIRPEAFVDARRYTPRTLLKRVDDHLDLCLKGKAVLELNRLGGEPLSQDRQDRLTRGAPVPPQPWVEIEAADLASLDAWFHELRGRTDVSAAFTKETEDDAMSVLLNAGLDAWVRELGEELGALFGIEQLSRRNPSLHASLHMLTDQHVERQHKWAFRAISAEDPRSVIPRVRNAVGASGISADRTNRQLILLRNADWPKTPRAGEEVANFKARGGISRCVTSEDLKTFGALKAMLAEPRPGLRDWLLVRQPAHHTELLRHALGNAGQPGSGQPTVGQHLTKEQQVEGQHRQEAGQDEPGPTALWPAPAAKPTIYIGATVPGQAPVNLELEALRRHVSVFAASGSGKTVLLRRIIESCALHGVSSIVLDANNDLTRLGDASPTPQENWVDGDAERAADYLANTDVAIWTPGLDRGRPLSFQPLPAFADILDDDDKLRARDEFQAAVDLGVETLAPLVNADKGTDKAQEEKAVLREALEYFGRASGGSLGEFITLLSDLPDEASTIVGGTTTAAGLARRLHNARVIDRQLGGSGQPVDPGVLLRPPPGKRARVSVISLAGLPAGRRPGFVNQLQMALFSWIKKHPADDGQLSGLFVMDEAQNLAPSGRSTPCRESTLQLVNQARKYGLGMLFATQQPKGLDNAIPNSSTTQLYGLLGSPAQIEAARELARMKGSDIPDVGRLKRGQFYFGTEGSGFRKVLAPMCLSRHSGPLTEEEVIRRARG